MAAVSAKQRFTMLRYHRQSTDTKATVDRNISAEVPAECQPTCRPIVSTDGLLTRTTYRPSIGRYVGRHISAEYRSICRPRVSTDTRSTDALSTHDPIYLSFGLLKAVPNDISPEKKRSTRHAVPVPFLAKEGNDFSVFALCARTRTPHIWYQIF